MPLLYAYFGTGCKRWPDCERPRLIARGRLGRPAAGDKPHIETVLFYLVFTYQPDREACECLEIVHRLASDQPAQALPKVPRDKRLLLEALVVE